MKKFVAILLICLLTANISGASVSYHFCGKMLQYLTLGNQQKEKKCCCAVSAKKKKCCKTQHCKVTVDESKSFAKQLSIDKLLITEAVPAPVTYYAAGKTILTDRLYNVPMAHAPPLVRSVHLHVLYQQFLI